MGQGWAGADLPASHAQPLHHRRLRGVDGRPRCRPPSSTLCLASSSASPCFRRTARRPSSRPFMRSDVDVTGVAMPPPMLPTSYFVIAVMPSSPAAGRACTQSPPPRAASSIHPSCIARLRPDMIPLCGLSSNRRIFREHKRLFARVYPEPVYTLGIDIHTESHRPNGRLRRVVGPPRQAEGVRRCRIPSCSDDCTEVVQFGRDVQGPVQGQQALVGRASGRLQERGLQGSTWAELTAFPATRRCLCLCHARTPGPARCR